MTHATITTTLAFVGSLTRDTPFFAPAQGVGITSFAVDEATGTFSLLAQMSGIDNPTYLAIDAVGCALYATSEVVEWHEGDVTAFAIEAATGRLTYLNKQPTLGHLSAFLSLDNARRHLLIANYSMQAPHIRPGRSLVVLPIDDDGIRPASSSLIREGSGPVADRQERSHAHCMVMGPDGVIAVADLGTDEVSFYRLDDGTGALIGPVARVALPPGSGPRHVAYSADGRRLYVINELASEAMVLRRTGPDADFELAQCVSTLPPGADASSRAAGIVIGPDGRHLFTSNRGHDSVASFAIDQASGLLAFRGACASGGATPRSLTVDPSGRFVIVANQDSHNLVALRIDPQTGALSHGHVAAAVASPTCVTIVRLTVATPDVAQEA